MSVWLSVLLASSVCAFALDPSLDVSQYAHTARKVGEGFSQGTIRSIVQTPDGYLWLGTEFGLLRLDGVSIVDPRHLSFNKLPPPVHIEQVIADRNTYDVTSGPNRHLRLPPLVRDIRIDLTALSFIAPGRIIFRHKLEGQNADWKEVAIDRRAQYSNLPPGNYRFRVTASNGSSVWNQTCAFLHFSIARAYYQTNWFRALCTAGALALIWALYRLRIRQLKQQEQRSLEAIETIPAMAFTAQPDGSRTFVNRRWVEYTGLNVGQAAGSGWGAAVHPDDLNSVLEKWRMSLATGEPLEYEARFRGADGEYRWFQVRAVPLRDEQGDILRWSGVTTDIEDRKRAEALIAGEKRVLEHVAKGDPLPEILDSLCLMVEEQASGALASILLVEGDQLKRGGAPSLPKAYTDAIDGGLIGPCACSCGTAAYCGEQIIVENISTDPLWADYRDAALRHSLRACWSTPVLSSHGNVIATFAMYYRESRRPSQRDQEIIERITQLAGVAIERKLIYDQLQRSEAYLAEAQRMNHTGSWAFSAEGRGAYWSEESFRMWGFDPQQGFPDLEIVRQRIHPADLDRVRGITENAVRTRTDYEQEFRIVLPDGATRHIHTAGHPVFDSKEQFVELVGTHIDVTERKRVEEALRRSEAYLAEAQRLSHTGSWAYKLGGVPAYWSEENFRIWEFDPQQGVPDLELVRQRIHPEDRERAMDEAARGAQTGTDFAQDFRIMLPNGTVRQIQAVGHLICNAGGEVIEVVGTHVDATERKRAEEERERLRQLEAELAHMNRLTMLGELASSLAHEINQPIAAAITSAHAGLRWLTRNPPDLERARAAIVRIEKDGSRAAEIIQRLRTFCKTGIPPQRELVDINQVVGEMLVLLRDEASGHSISLRTELTPQLPQIVADRVQLQQVLMNLMLNGIEAMSDGGGELTIRSHRTENGYLLISVSDTGVGLPGEKVDLIFNAFYTTKPQGTGMGLAISRSIIEAHGGRLWATANEQRGATFHFTVPAEGRK